MSSDSHVTDMKAGLTSGSKPKLSLLPRAGLTHAARGMEYGDQVKYTRGNYLRPPPESLASDPKRRAVLRLLGHVDAALRHLTDVSDALNRALGTDGDILAAVRVVDDKSSDGHPPSMLPHLSHGGSAVLMAIACAVEDGLLPADPGQTWVEAKAPEKPKTPARPCGDSHWFGTDPVGRMSFCVLPEGHVPREHEDEYGRWWERHHFSEKG